MDARSRQPLPLDEAEVGHAWDALIGPEGSSFVTDFGAKIREMQQEAWKTLGVVRNGRDLQAGYDDFIREYEAQPAYAARNASDLRSQSHAARPDFHTGLVCASGALAREETRGGMSGTTARRKRTNFWPISCFKGGGGFIGRKEPATFGAEDIAPEKEIMP